MELNNRLNCYWNKLHNRRNCNCFIGEGQRKKQPSQPTEKKGVKWTDSIQQQQTKRKKERRKKWKEEYAIQTSWSGNLYGNNKGQHMLVRVRCLCGESGWNRALYVDFRFKVCISYKEFYAIGLFLLLLLLLFFRSFYRSFVRPLTGI